MQKVAANYESVQAARSASNPNTLAPKPNPKASQQVGTLPKGCGKVRRCVGLSLRVLLGHFHVDVLVQRFVSVFVSVFVR